MTSASSARPPCSSLEEGSPSTSKNGEWVHKNSILDDGVTDDEGDPNNNYSSNNDSGDESSSDNAQESPNRSDRQYAYDRNDSAVRDAMVASTALMGENILDSPSQKQQSPSRVFQLRDRSALGTPSSESRNSTVVLPAAPSLQSSSSNEDRYDHPPAAAPLTADNANALSVGIMAQGLAWARRQRDRRQRQYLQFQAEKQLRKIRQAQEEEKAAVEAPDPGRSLLDNPIFQNLMATTTTRSRQSSVDDDAFFTEGNNVDNDSGDDDNVLSTKVSKSGRGYTVELPVSPSEPEEEDASWIPPVRVEDESDMSTCPLILSASEMQQIAVHVLPQGIAYCKWKRYYSLARDGDSFDACLRSIERESKTLLVVRTSRNAVFGGFADEPWEQHVQGGACYYGGPSACLFQVVVPAADAVAVVDETAAAAAAAAEGKTATSTSSTAPTKSKIKHYHWTGANRYVQLCDVKNKMLAFGGGGDDGAFGLCVHQDFQVGSTGPCATFANEPLCEQGHFDIVDMEIYGFLVGQF